MEKNFYCEWKETSGSLNVWAKVTQYQDAAAEYFFQDLVDFALKILLFNR